MAQTATGGGGGGGSSKKKTTKKKVKSNLPPTNVGHYGVPTHVGNYGVPTNVGRYGVPTNVAGMIAGAYDYFGNPTPPISGPAGSANAAERRLGIAPTPAAIRATPKPKPKSPASVVPNDSSLGMPTYDIESMLNAEFDPQYALLNRLRQQATSRYTTAGKEVGGMYEQLAKQFRGQEGGIKAEHAAAATALKNSLASATGDVANEFAKSRADIAERAARLGVETGAGQRMTEAADQQNNITGLMNAITQNWQGLNTAQQSSDIEYNRENANTTQMMGADARQSFAGMLQSALDDYGNKELELRGQEGAAGNKYRLSIADMLQEAQKNSQSNQIDQGKLLLGQAELAQRVKEAAAKAAASGAREIDYRNMPADRALEAMAAQMYPNSQAAHNAMQAITDTISRGYRGDRYWTDVQDFMDSVAARNTGANDYNSLAALARLYYGKITGGKNGAYGVQSTNRP